MSNERLDKVTIDLWWNSSIELAKNKQSVLTPFETGILNERVLALLRELEASKAEHLGPLSKTVNEINKANGWDVIKPEEWGSTPHKVPAILALIHSEVSEALEAFRKDDRANFDEELADVVIRVLDCAGGLGIDLETAILKKLEKNKTRGHRHGGKRV